MDWITHSATGYFLGQLAVPESGRPRRAGWWWIIAAISPDWLEFGTRWFGDIHRGVTHSLYMWPILALAWAGAARRWGKRQGTEVASVGRLWIAFVLVVGSHLLLDIFMSYRLYFFWPFSEANYAWNIMPLYDIWVFAGWLLLLVVWLIWRQPSCATASVGLAILLFCFTLRGGTKVRAHALLGSDPTSAGRAIERIAPANYKPWVWYIRFAAEKRWTVLNVLTGEMLHGQDRPRLFMPIPWRGLLPRSGR